MRSATSVTYIFLYMPHFMDSTVQPQFRKRRKKTRIHKPAQFDGLSSLHSPMQTGSYSLERHFAECVSIWLQMQFVYCYSSAAHFSIAIINWLITWPRVFFVGVFFGGAGGGTDGKWYASDGMAQQENYLAFSQICQILKVSGKIRLNAISHFRGCFFH